MPLIYLVRHAKPIAVWGEAVDPGLDETGIHQAANAAHELHKLPHLDVYTSPLRRCVETAAPLAELWNVTPRIFAAVAEIPSPPLSTLKRREWLTAGMQGTWSLLQATAPPGSPDFLQWRADLLRSVQGLTDDSIIFTHYIAINVLVGSAQDHDRVISFKPDHASISVVDVSRNGVAVVKLGAQTTGGDILLGR